MYFKQKTNLLFIIKYVWDSCRSCSSHKAVSSKFWSPFTWTLAHRKCCYIFSMFWPWFGAFFYDSAKFCKIFQLYRSFVIYNCLQYLKYSLCWGLTPSCCPISIKMGQPLLNASPQFVNIILNPNKHFVFIKHSSKKC